MESLIKGRVGDNPIHVGAVYLFLIAATVFVYAPVVHCDFVRFDDQDYITENATVQRGMTTRGLRWAFTTNHGGNWHPVTWVSHMLDCQLYGLHPAGHHLTNLLIHMVNALVLFEILRYATENWWRSVVVAALFAVHPLHVESVAWVSERKDVLSTLFALLSMLAYVAYVKRQRRSLYLASILFFAVGLMAKPMLVSLPFVFLLLDYWPLERDRRGYHGILSRDGTNGGGTQAGKSVPSIVLLAAEKVPMLMLSICVCIVTCIVERGAMGHRGAVPFHLCLANAVMSYLKYIMKMVWPRPLAIYLHPYLRGGIPWARWQIVAAGLLLILITALLVSARRRRYGIVGWLWYLGTLVPVIGIIRVGFEGMADRYTYIPSIGISIAVVWGAADLVGKLELGGVPVRKMVLAGAIIALGAYSVCARSQVRHWRDSYALFGHAADAEPQNHYMVNNFGMERLLRGETEEAVKLFRHALRVDPCSYGSYYNLGVAAHYQGNLEEATRYYRLAIQLRPDFAEGYYNLGHALASTGQLDDAVVSYRQALKAKPRRWAGIRAETHNNLGYVLLLQGKLDAAASQFRQALEAEPRLYRARYNLGEAMVRSGCVDEAIGHFREALRILPEWVLPMDALARIHSIYSSPDSDLAGQAVHLARRVADLTNWQNAGFLDTLAAAYAASGDFDEAIVTAQGALDLARQNGDEWLCTEIGKRLELYQRGQPYRESQPDKIFSVGAPLQEFAKADWAITSLVLQDSRANHDSGMYERRPRGRRDE